MMKILSTTMKRVNVWLVRQRCKAFLKGFAGVWPKRLDTSQSGSMELNRQDLIIIVLYLVMILAMVLILVQLIRLGETVRVNPWDSSTMVLLPLSL